MRLNLRAAVWSSDTFALCVKCGHVTMEESSQSLASIFQAGNPLRLSSSFIHSELDFSRIKAFNGTLLINRFAFFNLWCTNPASVLEEKLEQVCVKAT